MAGFCGNCGAPIRAPFCVKCGHPVDAGPEVAAAPAAGAASPVAPISPVPVAAPPVGQSGGLGKIILAVVLVFAVLAMMAAGAVVYGLYWAKKKVATYSTAVSGGNGEQVTVAHGNSCALLSTAELQQSLGVIVERSEEITDGDTPGCAYFTNPAAFAKLRQMALEQTKRDSARASQHPQPKSDNPLFLGKDGTKGMEGVMKSFGLQEPAKDGQVFSFTVDRNSGSGAWSAMKTASSLVPGFVDVPGLGDHAMVGAFGHSLYVFRGDAMIALNTNFVPDTQTRGAEIARRILGRL